VYEKIYEEKQGRSKLEFDWLLTSEMLWAKKLSNWSDWREI